jgi:hypothetical protein
MEQILHHPLKLNSFIHQNTLNMKTILVNTLLLVLILLSSVTMSAQTSISKPDQQKLIKQFVGQWKAVTGNDTIMTSTFKAFGNGLDGSMKIETSAGALKEGRQLFGYDSKTDTFIEAEMTTGSDMELWACWFISNKIFIGVPLTDLANPSKAITKVEVIIQSPDTFVQHIYQNGIAIGKKTMKRVPIAEAGK